MKTWIKLYTEVNEDPKIGSLTWAQRGIWAALLALAGRLDYRDENDEETGSLNTLENTAWHLRCQQDELLSAIEAFREREMIDERDGVLYITNYAKRQHRPPSASREAVAERVQRHRETKPEKCNEDVTSLQKNVTPLEKKRKDTESDSEEIILSASADYHAIRLRWLELFPDKPRPRENNKTLTGKVCTRMKSPHFREHWQAALNRASRSKFLHNGGWFDLGWFLKNDDHYAKCLNGNYDNGSHKRSHQSRERTIKIKPPACEVDPETQARQRAALAELQKRKADLETQQTPPPVGF